MSARGTSPFSVLTGSEMLGADQNPDQGGFASNCITNLTARVVSSKLAANDSGLSFERNQCIPHVTLIRPRHGLVFSWMYIPLSAERSCMLNGSSVGQSSGPTIFVRSVPRASLDWVAC